MPFFTRRDRKEDTLVPEATANQGKKISNKTPVRKDEDAQTKKRTGDIVITRRESSSNNNKNNGSSNIPGRFPSPTPTASTQATFYTDPGRRPQQQQQDNANANTSDDGTILRRSSTGNSGVLHKFQLGKEELDPSIVKARERVLSAEAAEQEADRALEAARREVNEARAEVKRLEVEAKEEARRARIKTYYAKEVSKRGKALGRHDL